MNRPVALITGAGGRLGRAMAFSLAKAGYAIAVHYNSSEASAAATAAEVQAAGGTAAAVGANLGALDALAPLVESAADALGPVSCLVNNASLFNEDTVSSMTPETWHSHLDVNLRAPVMLSKVMAEKLPIDVGGLIVNMLDETVLNPGPNFFSYTLSKTALAAATEMLAQALAPQVRVNGIAPGLILNSGHSSEEAFLRDHIRTPLRRGPRPEAICQALRYFVDAREVTGQVITVDAGRRYYGSWTRLHQSESDA